MSYELITRVSIMLFLGMDGEDLAAVKINVINSLFLRLDPKMSVALTMTFNQIAMATNMGKPIERVVLQDQLQTSRPQMGKILSYLFKVDYRGKVGHDLIIELPSPRGGKALVYSLNERGVKLNKIMIGIMAAKNGAGVYGFINEFEDHFGELKK